MHKQLEIYGTIGPSCCTQEVMEQLFQAGMTGMRLNLSHTNLKDHPNWLQAFHKASQQAQGEVQLLIDMKGPELRIGSLKPTELNEGAIVDLDCLAFPSFLLETMEMGQEILLDDGKILLKTLDTARAKVIRGGTLLAHKSIALKGKNIETQVLTDSDIQNLRDARKYGVTGIMQPFVRCAQDLIYIRKILEQVGASHLKIYAKIENMQGYENLESLFPYCDQIIIARGDLGNAVGLTRLPSIQHSIEQRCKKHGMPYMVVTQMLHSMETKAVPTRAEVSDIYAAVYNGASSIMLTGETAAGRYPVEAMKVFVETANYAFNDRES